MTSDFERTMLAKLIHEDTIAKNQQRKLARSMKKQAYEVSKQYQRIVIRQGKPCQC